MSLEELKKAVQVRSHSNERCAECDDLLPSGGNVVDRINHYLGHGYKLVHIGMEGGGSPSGSYSFETVAILAK